MKYMRKHHATVTNRAVARDVTSAAFNQNVWYNVWLLYSESGNGALATRPNYARKIIFIINMVLQL